MTSRSTAGSRWVGPALLAIVVVTLIIYARTIGNGFIDFDDPENVIDNQTIRSFSGTNIEHWFSSPLQFMYTPLVSLSYALDFALGGTSAAGYHVTNLALHLINVALVWAVVRALTRRDVVAVFAAGAFAIHPVNVDGVAWVATRSNLLATAFLLGALLAYAQYVSGDGQRLLGRKGDRRSADARWWWLALALVLFVAATFSKSAAVVLPVILLLWDYAVQRRWHWSLVWEKVPFFAVSLVMGIVGLHFRNDTNDFTDFTALDRLFIAASAMWAYVTRVVLPYPLSFAYAYPDKDGGSMPFGVYLAPLLLLAVVVATFFMGVPRRMVVFGWGFFFATTVLSQTVLLIDNYKPNRYAYLPYVGIFVILGYLVERLLDRARSANWVRYTTIGALAAFALSFCVLTVQRAGLWKDTVTLLDASVQHEPDVPFVYNSLGIAKYKAGDYAGAVANYGKVSELDPMFNVYNNLGTVQLAMGQAQTALESYNRAIEMNPGYVDAYFNRGVARIQLGDLPGACTDWVAAQSMGFPPAAQALVDNSCP